MSLLCFSEHIFLMCLMCVFIGTWSTWKPCLRCAEDVLFEGCITNSHSKSWKCNPMLLPGCLLLRQVEIRDVPASFPTQALSSPLGCKVLHCSVVSSTCGNLEVFGEGVCWLLLWGRVQGLYLQWRMLYVTLFWNPLSSLQCLSTLRKSVRWH